MVRPPEQRLLTEATAAGAYLPLDTVGAITPAEGCSYTLNKVRKLGGVVVLSFVANKAAIAVNDVIGTLPAEYCPAVDTYIAGQAYAGGFGSACFKVGASGNIVCTVLPPAATGVQASVALCI